MSTAELDTGLIFDDTEIESAPPLGADFSLERSYEAETGLLFTPVHKETGISYPVYVRPEDFIADKRRQHHTEHPSPRPELADYVGKALRISRTQELPDHLHMGYVEGAYHNVLWGPEKLPQDPHGKMLKTLLLIGRVIPRQAMVLEPDGYTVKELSDEEHAFLSHPEITHVEGRNNRKRQFVQRRIADALIKYALEDVNDLVSAKVRKDFLNTYDWHRERELGNLIINTAINEAIKPAIGPHEQARSDGMVDPRVLSLRSIVRNYTYKNDYRNYYGFIHERLEDSKPALQTGVNRLQLAA
jgi:hypothetical protein